MAKYYVNKNAQDNGDYEVYREGCEWMPEAHNKMYLGDFNNYRDAVKEAKKTYRQSNGCFYCSNDCHTT